MSESASETGRVIYTIGHSNHPLEAFLDLLHARHIDVLVDVRSRPYSKYAPHFNGQTLKEAVVAAGIRYAFFGKELGGRPDGAQFYDADGHVLYGRVAESPLFLEGISRLEKGIPKYRVAMMCSEENPAVCHRRLLVARVLTARGVSARHIRGDGRLQTEAELSREEASQAAGAGQASLFGAEEVTEWKSLRSVLPKKPPA
jgi:uncharacterized protein (DUF488 family)